MAKSYLDRYTSKRPSGKVTRDNRSLSLRMDPTPKLKSCLAMSSAWCRWTKISIRLWSSKKLVGSFLISSRIGCSKEKSNRKRSCRKAGKAQAILELPITLVGPTVSSRVHQGIGNPCWTNTSVWDRKRITVCSQWLIRMQISHQISTKVACL